MPKNNILLSSIGPSKEVGSVFEDDGDTGYFYLCEIKDGQPSDIKDAIHIYTGNPGITKEDLRITWNSQGNETGLLIKNELWAAFNTLNGVKRGGDYTQGGKPDLM